MAIWRVTTSRRAALLVLSLMKSTSKLPPAKSAGMALVVVCVGEGVGIVLQNNVVGAGALHRRAACLLRNQFPAPIAEYHSQAVGVVAVLRCQQRGDVVAFGRVVHQRKGAGDNQARVVGGDYSIEPPGRGRDFQRGAVCHCLNSAHWIALALRVGEISDLGVGQRRDVGGGVGRTSGLRSIEICEGDNIGVVGADSRVGVVKHRGGEQVGVVGI